MDSEGFQIIEENGSSNNRIKTEAVGFTSMECIFLQEEKSCTANPPRNAITAWQVDADTLKDYCRNKDFESCPRFIAYMKYHAKET